MYVRRVVSILEEAQRGLVSSYTLSGIRAEEEKRDAKKKKKGGIMAAAPANSRPRRVIGLDTSHRLNVTLPSARIPPLPNIGRRLK